MEAERGRRLASDEIETLPGLRPGPADSIATLLPLGETSTEQHFRALRTDCILSEAAARDRRRGHGRRQDKNMDLRTYFPHLNGGHLAKERRLGKPRLAIPEGTGSAAPYDVPLARMVRRTKRYGSAFRAIPRWDETTSAPAQAEVAARGRVHAGGAGEVGGGRR